MKHIAQVLTNTFIHQDVAGGSDLAMAGAASALALIFPYLVQYTYLGNHKVSWRMDLAEKQLYWHKRSPSTPRSGDMNLGWAEEERQYQPCKTFVQLELKRSGLNKGNSSAAIIMGLFGSPFILLRASIRQLQVKDIISLLL